MLRLRALDAPATPLVRRTGTRRDFPIGTVQTAESKGRGLVERTPYALELCLTAYADLTNADWGGHLHTTAPFAAVRCLR